MANPLHGLNKYLTPTNLIIGSGLLIAGYLGSHYLAKQQTTSSDGITADYTVNPIGIKPNLPGTITLSGQFSAPVDKAFFYIYDPNQTLVASGFLGDNVTKFVKAVDLPPLPLGIFDVVVTDTQRGIAPVIEGVDPNI